MNFEKYFDDNLPQILESMEEIMSIDSSYSHPLPGKPFGAGSAQALRWGAEQGKKLGLEVKNFGNYAVSMTCGKDPVLGILSHLDVVPAKRDPDLDIWVGWTHKPFACTLEDGVIYGRGAIDDKGPSVAVLYAVKCIQDMGIRLKNGFRIIFGGGEETGCDDIRHYEKLEPFPPMVFTPDGSFPVLNCEKGMLHLKFSAAYKDGNYRSITAGEAVNAIPEVCTAVYLPGDTGYMEETFLWQGKASHGSRPENGDNAITKFLEAAANEDRPDPVLARLHKLFPHGEFDGASCGLGFEDKISGRMTCALTMLNTENGRLHGGIDIRFPIDRKLDDIKAIISKALKGSGFRIDECDGMEPHYVPEDSDFVQTLLRVYERVKGEKGRCIAEGGVTYVHETPGGVAFGAEFPDENNNMHGAEEHISLQTLKYNFLMYVNAIIEICGVDES